MRIAAPRAQASIRRITVDDIDSFERVKRVKDAGILPEEISERNFKEGIQSILNEPGEFRDWGGEQCDLWSTRLVVDGRRLAAAFAFKGPGTRGKLTPRKMGKNSDQIQRLLQVPADVFIVQYWAEIDHSIIVELEAHATVRSVYAGREILYSTIDGADSNRIYRAYPDSFAEDEDTGTM